MWSGVAGGGFSLPAKTAISCEPHTEKLASMDNPRDSDVCGATSGADRAIRVENCGLRAATPVKAVSRMLRAVTVRADRLVAGSQHGLSRGALHLKLRTTMRARSAMLVVQKCHPRRVLGGRIPVCVWLVAAVAMACLSASNKSSESGSSAR